MSHVLSLVVSMYGTDVGRLSVGGDQNIYFQYNSAWLNSGFNISPISLKFDLSLQPSANLTFKGLHGVFNDSLPDGWGLLLMDRALKNKFDWSPNQITPLDRLAYIGSMAMGALEYKPDMEVIKSSDILNIADMAKSSIMVLNGSNSDIIPELMLHGGSPSGARPKVTVAMSPDMLASISGFAEIPDDYSHWIVKFNSNEDSLHSGLIEKCYAEMAELAGINMPKTAVIEAKIGEHNQQYFAVERFDRNNNDKIHMVSLSGMVEASHRVPCMDYDQILEVVSHVTKKTKDIEDAFRLMIFNVMTHNKDDHVKNFAFLYENNQWKFSPAFDLTFSGGIGNQHTSAINGSGNPTIKDIEKIANSHSISNWKLIFDQVKLSVESFSSIAENKKVPNKLVKDISNQLNEISKRINYQIPSP